MKSLLPSQGFYSRRSSDRSRQRGASLIELMVGITIGLLVVMLAAIILVYNRVSATLVSDSVRMQQDAAIIMRMIGRQVKQAAAVPAQEYQPYGATTEKFTYRTDYGGHDLTNQNTSNPVSVFGTNGTRDQLTVSFAIDERIRNLSTDCHGSPEANAAIGRIRSQFSVNAAGEFRCLGNTINQPIVDNVEDLQVWYALRDAATNTVRYRDAGQVGAAGGWGAVEAVLVCVRLSSPSSNNTTVATIGCSGEPVANDGRIRRVFRQVFTLRNVADLG